MRHANTRRLLVSAATFLALALVAPAASAKKIHKKKGGEVDVETPATSDGPAETRPVPAGFLPMLVLGVIPTDGGGTVLLVDHEEKGVVPIGVGATEALVIALRAERTRYERPLTHDLLDQVMRELGGTLVDARIDDLTLNGVFVATVTIQQDGKEVKMDARSSDAIAMALGAQIPIYLSEHVYSASAMSLEEFMGPLEPPSGVEPPEEEPVEEEPPTPAEPASKA